MSERLTESEREVLRRVDRRLRENSLAQSPATVRVAAGDWTNVEAYVERILAARGAGDGLVAEFDVTVPALGDLPGSSGTFFATEEEATAHASAAGRKWTHGHPTAIHRRLVTPWELLDPDTQGADEEPTP